MLHSNVDRNIAQLHHYSQYLSDRIGVDPDHALQTVLILQAEAYEDIEPECPISSPEEIFDYVEHQVGSRVEALIDKNDALAYAHAYQEQQYRSSLERLKDVHPEEYDVHMDILLDEDVPRDEAHRTVLLYLHDYYGHEEDHKLEMFDDFESMLDDSQLPF